MLLHIEGFDGGGINHASMRLYVGKKYPTASIGGTTGTGPGRYDNGQSWFGYSDGQIPFYVNDKQTIIIGFALKRTAWHDDKFILKLLDDTALQIGLKTITGGELRLVRGSTTLGTTSGLGGTINTWYYIELKIKVDSATGSYELHVDEINVLSAFNINTQETSNAYIDVVQMYIDSSAWHYFDDIYILDDTGGRNNDFLGDMKIVLKSPNAIGDSSQFTPLSGDNYANVDDGVTPDWDTTYVKSSIIGHKDLYNYEDVAPLTGIAGVAITADVKKTNAIIRKLKTIAKFGPTESVDFGQSISADYGMLTRIMETDPNNNLWETTVLDATQFGFELA